MRPFNQWFQYENLGGKNPAHFFRRIIMSVLVMTATNPDDEIIALTKAGHSTSQIARMIGMTKTTGGTRTDHEARSWIYKRQVKLGLRKPKKDKNRKRRPEIPSLPFLLDNFFENAPSEEDRIGFDPTQKVHPFAFTVAEMVNAQDLTSSVARAILNVSSPHHPSPDRFLELINQMMAWIPDKEKKGSGWDTDYAAKAVKTLNSVQRNLDTAIERLLILQTLLKARNAPKDKEPST